MSDSCRDESYILVRFNISWVNERFLLPDCTGSGLTHPSRSELHDFIESFGRRCCKFRKLLKVIKLLGRTRPKTSRTPHDYTMICRFDLGTEYTERIRRLASGIPERNKAFTCVPHLNIDHRKGSRNSEYSPTKIGLSHSTAGEVHSGSVCGEASDRKTWPAPVLGLTGLKSILSVN